MKWGYYIKNKLKAAGALVVILLLILSGNFATRQKFADVDKSVLSLYNDRLKPSVFIYEISHHLYEKRLLLSHQNLASPANNAAVQKHNHVIASLMRQYEQTYLTNEERHQWNSFKAHLSTYNQMEQAYLDNGNAAGSARLVHQFDKTIGDLNALNTIQVTVGDGLRADAHTTVGSSLLLSTLEISLLIVLGLFTLVILSTSENRLFRNYTEKAHLN